MSFLAAEGRPASSCVRVNCRRPASLRRPTSETEPRATRDERLEVTRAYSCEQSSQWLRPGRRCSRPGEIDDA